MRRAAGPDQEPQTGAQNGEQTQPQANGAGQQTQHRPLLFCDNGASPAANEEINQLQTQPDTTCKCSKRFLLATTVSLVITVAVLGITVAVLALRSPSQTKAPHHCPEQCPAGWMRYRQTCYYFTKNKLDWEQSRSFCRVHNATLIVIDSHDELDFLRDYLSLGLPWIGLHRTEGAGVLQWVTGAPYNQSLYQIVIRGECAYLQPDSIYLSGCMYPRTWICKKQPDH